MVFHRLGPYHRARLNEAARLQCLVALELSAHSAEYAWDKLSGDLGFERLTLFPDGDSRQASVSELRACLSAALQRVNPEVVVVPGWSDKGALATLTFSSRNRVPLVVMSESAKHDERRTSWREWVKRRVVKMCSAALVGGRIHADYVAELGMPRGQISIGYDAVDNEHFAKGAAQSKEQSAKNRHKYCLPEKYFLASARFIEKKNLPRLLKGYALYRQKAKSGKQQAQIWDLVLLGDGPLRPILNSQLSALNLGGNVHMPGFRQYPDLPAYYGLANAFVHAGTTEQWGLVVNEAMASGLPVLVSNRCGCAPDLVQEGVNGWTFDPYDVEALAELMLKVSAFYFPLSAYGDASRRIIADWGPERFASGLKEAVDKALEVGPKPASWLDRVLLRLLMLR